MYFPLWTLDYLEYGEFQVGGSGLLKNYQIEERSFGIDKDGVLLNAAILDFENPSQFKKVPFTVEDLIKDNNPYSVKSSRIHPDQVQLEDLVISYFQFFVKK